MSSVFSVDGHSSQVMRRHAPPSTRAALPSVERKSQTAPVRQRRNSRSALLSVRSFVAAYIGASGAGRRFPVSGSRWAGLVPLMMSPMASHARPASSPSGAQWSVRYCSSTHCRSSASVRGGGVPSL